MPSWKQLPDTQYRNQTPRRQATQTANNTLQCPIADMHMPTCERDQVSASAPLQSVSDRSNGFLTTLRRNLSEFDS